MSEFTVTNINSWTLGALIAPEASIHTLEWARRHRVAMQNLISARGALLFRGFGVAELPEFRDFVAALVGDPISYLDASTPRTLVKEGVYTATEYPAEQGIPPHNEHSYSAIVPRFLCFYCHFPAPTGGATVLLDSEEVYSNIQSEIRKQFEDLGVLYVRNFYDWTRPTWQVAFGTDSRTEVEDYCRAHGITCEWRGTTLHTEQRRPAVTFHPVSGGSVWLNQAHLFHVSSLEDSVRSTFEELFSPDEYPRNVLFGDRTPIPDAYIQEIAATYYRLSHSLPLEKGDVLVLDNIKVAHGREPYSGRREMYVFMSQPWRFES